MQNENIHKRGRYSAEFKEKVTLEALSGAKTHVQIAAEYGISPDLAEGLGEAMEMTAEWLGYYNKGRPHSALGYRSPEMYRESVESPMAANFLRDFFAPAQLAALPLRLRLRSTLFLLGWLLRVPSEFSRKRHLGEPRYKRANSINNLLCLQQPQGVIQLLIQQENAVRQGEKTFEHRDGANCNFTLQSLLPSHSPSAPERWLCHPLRDALP